MQKTYTIGVDVGGTKMTSILWNGKKAIADFTLATPKDNLEHFLIMFQALIEPLLEIAKKDRAKVGKIGIGIPAPLDKKRERILIAPNLSILNNVKLAGLIKERFGIEAIMDNDANCFIRAEASIGAGKGMNNVYGITLGTGIGGGQWVEGKIYAGANGGGAEPGHMIIDYKEQTDLENAYHKITHNDPAEVAERAFRGDLLAEKIFEEFGQMFGCALANIVNLIDPEIIIVGGSVVKSSALFLKKADEIMKKNIISPDSKKIKVVKGKLDALAGAIGAALL